MPYDRFLNHLDKCKFADKKSYAKCRYNPYHVFHKETIANHEKSIIFFTQNAKTGRSTRPNPTMTAGELKTISKNPKSQLSPPQLPPSLRIALSQNTQPNPNPPKWPPCPNTTGKKPKTSTITTSWPTKADSDDRASNKPYSWVII